MRRKEREITDVGEMVDIMQKCPICRIGLADGDYPYIVPVNFGLAAGNPIKIYFHGALAGRKYELIKANCRASFEMDRCEEYVQESLTARYESVMGTGIIELVEGEEKIDSLRLIMAHAGEVGADVPPQMAQSTAVFRLTVESITGKANRG